MNSFGIRNELEHARKQRASTRKNAAVAILFGVVMFLYLLTSYLDQLGGISK